MSSVTSGSARDRRQVTTQIKDGLRDLHNELSTLNRQIGAQLAIKDTDMDCIDLINRHGPISPSALARQAGLHPATVTGVLDRLERAGWIARERDPADRRAVTVRALPDRGREIYQLFAGMNSAMDAICADYDEKELAVLAGFLRRVTDAGTAATRALADGSGARD
jgi:DNA-binding MarR family transcriptional regulator